MDKETKDLLEELKQSNGYISISELAKRFEKIDMLYNHDYWNLTQILANINLIIPVELDVIHCKDCKHLYFVFLPEYSLHFLNLTK